MTNISNSGNELVYTPTVSIGLPVYNGEATLSEALDSLLSQTFDDFEVIICDNASTDGTSAIAKEYTQKDKRIRYYRSKSNRGAANNFNWAFQLSRGEFFKWHAADDIILPDFLKDCIVPLKESTDVVLSFPTRRFMTHEGQILEGEKSLIRYRQLPDNGLNDISLTNVLRLSLSRVPLLVFGLIRSTVLEKTGLIGKFIASDHCLVYELRLHGRFAQIPRVLYLQRIWPYDPSTAWRMTRKGESSWFGAFKGLAVRSPEINLFVEMLKAYKRAYYSRDQYNNVFRRKAIRTIRDLLSFRAHVEIRLARSVIIPYRRMKTKMFRSWTDLSESFLHPDKPNITALRVWRIGAAAVGGRVQKIRKLIISGKSAFLLAESLGRLMHRGNESSLKRIAQWLKCEDNDKADIAVRAFLSSSHEDQARFLRYLDQSHEFEAQSRLRSLTTYLDLQPASPTPELPNN